MKTATQISQQIRAQLKVLDPSISAEPLTPERKIIDTVAQAIAEANVDSWVLNYQFDIDTKAGSDLDKFVAMFGFARQGARKARGIVTFSRGTPAEEDILIPAGTQVQRPSTAINTTVLFITTASVVLPQGGTSVDAPIEASITGPLGNVPAGTISQYLGGAFGVTDVSNTAGTTGGEGEETDAELRARFKNTIFRNIAGTRDQFLALSIASKFASKATVIGPKSSFVEYLQVPSGGVGATITSQIPFGKYTYTFDYWLTDGNIIDERFYTPNGVEYRFNDLATSGVTSVNQTQPIVEVRDAAALPTSTVVMLEHSYCSSNSRNDPANDVGNYVDVYVSGADEVGASESANFPSTAFAFDNTGSSPYYRQNFRRVKTNEVPVLGNRFQELLWQPATIAPAFVSIDGVTYREGTHYWLVRDITVYKGSKRARNGLEWDDSVADTIPNGTEFVFSYTFDKLPLTLNELMDAHKQVTTDVLVHSAVERLLNINIVVMYTPGFSPPSVDQGIEAALTAFFDSQNFGTVIQISDLLDVIHEVPGVDNVRMATPSDETAYGIQEVAGDGSTPIGVPYEGDFYLMDSDLPVLNLLTTTRRSQNSWQ